jgi:hypothetical protein
MTDEFLERFEENRKAREQAERSFPLLGETLTFRAHVPYEIGRGLEAARMRFADDLGEAQRRLNEANGTAPDLSDLTLNTDELVSAADAQILACLEPESREAWARLRALDAAEPLNFHEIGQIADYLLGRVSGIPTDAPAGSSGGRKTTASKSKAASSSTARTSKV